MEYIPNKPNWFHQLWPAQDDPIKLKATAIAENSDIYNMSQDENVMWEITASNCENHGSVFCENS